MGWPNLPEMKIQIHVTRKDIKLGKRGHCGICPVAIAISRASGREAWVSGNCLLFRQVGGLSEAILLPGTVSQFVTKFDTGKQVDPFFFIIEIPS